MGMSAKRFRIAFSFAGERRNFVAQVATILAKKFSKDAILYDKFHEAEFANWKLGLILQELYHDQSDMIVVVVCPDYSKKDWCGLEWVTIHGMLMSGMDREIMLCRFAHAKLQGLNENAGFVELDSKTPEQAAELILQRLKLNESKGKKRKRSKPATTQSDPALPLNNLPRLTPFFGRINELKNIADALSPKTRTWGVLIDGPGGIGKTSLAIRAAELVPAGQFLHIFFISSKERKMTADGKRTLSDFVTPGYLDMLNEIARLLKQPDLAKQPETDRARCLIDALSAIQVLLVLDNLESLPKDQQSRLFEFLSQLPPSCKAITTSRRRTDVDARIIRLAKLDRDAALALIAELATDRPLLAKATAQERIHLYEETGGNPLLLRWVAGQLGKGRCRTIASALGFLRNAPADNDPLEFIFGDLLETFTQNETKVLAALTYFTQQVEVKLITELSNISKTAAETALGDLSGRALVVPDEEEKHFALVPMVADFLRRKRPEVVVETGSRLEQRAYALIMENSYERHDRFPVLDAAWPTVTPALPLFLAGPNPRLQTVSNALSYFLDFTGRWDELLSISQQAEAKAVAAGDYDNAGWRAYQMGRIHSLRGQADAVLACADRTAAHWQTAQADAPKRAIAICLRGQGHHLKEDYPAAIAAYREALDLSSTVSAESKDVAITINCIANAENDSGDFAAAERDYREALRVASAVDYAEGVAYITGNLAGLALERKDWSGAETLAREALTLAEKVGRQELIASDCRRFALALVRQGKKAEALPYARRAVDIYTSLGSPNLKYARAVLRECES
ncbi:MAG: tetratricopeptide repeat protein [Nitrospirae bacterium]|nr:MAG: tetratricopeptide repeat protein [Nitrospirota bacterium]